MLRTGDSTYQCNTLFPEFQEKTDNSRIPFRFTHTTQELYDKGLDLSEVGMYNILASYLNFNSEVEVDGQKFFRGYTVVISQPKLAERANASVRTVQRKLDKLVEVGEVKCHKSYRGCYVYELTAYKRAIEEMEKEAEEREKKQAPAPEFASANPSAPPPDKVEAYINQERTTSSQRRQANPKANHPSQEPGQKKRRWTSKKSQQTQDTAQAPHAQSQTAEPAQQPQPEPGTTDLHQLTTRLSYIEDVLRTLEETLSSGDTVEKTELEPTTQQDEEDLREFDKYIKAMYGEVKSKTYRIELREFFKEKVEDYGFAADGTDRTLQVIIKVKTLGGVTHVALDKEFGVRAYRMVIDEEEARMKRKRYEQQQSHSEEKQEPSFSLSEPENDPSTDPSSENPSTEPEETPESSSEIRPRSKPANRTVRRVSAAIESRKNVVKATGCAPDYTADEIEAMWGRSYEELGWPEDAKEWFDDRILCHEILVAKGVVEPLTDEEIEALIKKMEAYQRLNRKR